LHLWVLLLLLLVLLVAWCMLHCWLGWLSCTVKRMLAVVGVTDAATADERATCHGLEELRVTDAG
jgi:hypothetical protein